MKFPLQIAVRNSSISEAVEREIRRRTQKLGSFYDRIIKCRVMLEVPHRHQHKGIFNNVRIELTVPGKKILVKREKNTDIYIAIRDSFDAALRQLQTYVQRRRGKVKIREPLSHARVTKPFPEDGFGFIEPPDGREVYFHQNSV